MGLSVGAGGTRGGCMCGAGFLLFTTIVLMIVAISTNYWNSTDQAAPVALNNEGLWKRCFKEGKQRRRRPPAAATSEQSAICTSRCQTLGALTSAHLLTLLSSLFSLPYATDGCHDWNDVTFGVNSFTSVPYSDNNGTPSKVIAVRAWTIIYLVPAAVAVAVSCLSMSIAATVASVCTMFAVRRVFNLDQSITSCISCVAFLVLALIGLTNYAPIPSTARPP